MKKLILGLFLCICLVEGCDKIAFGVSKKSVVGVGNPFRPEIILKDDKEKKYQEEWKELIATGSPNKLLELIESKDRHAYRKFLISGLSPWIIAQDIIVIDKKGENLPLNHSIPGGIVETAVHAVWKNPTEGQHTLAKTKISPSWEIISGPFSMGYNLFGANPPIVFLSSTFVVRVPKNSKPGNYTLQAIGQAKGPAEATARTVSTDYKLIIDPLPRPDRETLLSFWGFIISKGKETFSDFDKTDRVLALQASQLLKLFGDQLDGEIKKFTKELLEHIEFKKAVKLLEEGEKKDKESNKSKSGN